MKIEYISISSDPKPSRSRVLELISRAIVYFNSSLSFFRF
ncbi:hypothetical protein CKA32_004695 [Geitlerinema sp. FC II]|nr:hypothetical protein CKA32_004695 [Geitlerinema sp. FC II]